MTADAISAAAMRCKTMADGSLRIEVEVEPRDAQAAFSLFGMPGAPMALAALRPGHAQAGATEPEPTKPAARPAAKKSAGDSVHLWSRWAALRCADSRFHDWLALHFGGPPIYGPGAAADVVREVCEVDSRARFDDDPAATERFHTRIRRPWQAYFESKGWTE